MRKFEIHLHAQTAPAKISMGIDMKLADVLNCIHLISRYWAIWCCVYVIEYYIISNATA